MKERKYETVCEIKKGSKEWALQFDLFLIETVNSEAAKALVEDRISFRRYRKVTKKMLKKHSHVWEKLYVFSGIDQEISPSSRIHRIGHQVFFQIEVEPDSNI